MAPQVEAIYAGIEAHIGVEFTQGLFCALDSLVGVLGGPAGEAEESP